MVTWKVRQLPLDCSVSAKAGIDFVNCQPSAECAGRLEKVAPIHKLASENSVRCRFVLPSRAMCQVAVKTRHTLSAPLLPIGSVGIGMDLLRDAQSELEIQSYGKLIQQHF